MIYTRQQFADMWNEEKPGLGDEDSPLWVPEHNWTGMDEDGPLRCVWFVCIKPLGMWDRSTSKEKFWHWCTENLIGRCRCFSSAGQEEWWGFTDKDDLVLFILRWAS